MRTTVTLDPDLAVRIKELARERGISFKSAINSALRAGLETASGSGRPYSEETRDLGARPELDLTKALRLAAALEDDETIRRLELRK
ncbi:MAG: ribbon-helix-helix protein, CopG family [Gaiellaceae bacterium]